MIGFHLEGFFELSSATCFTRDPASKKDHVVTLKLGGLDKSSSGVVLLWTGGASIFGSDYVKSRVWAPPMFETIWA